MTETEKKRCMLFVRNLPFSVTNGEFEEKFSAYGPIVQSFVVKDSRDGGEEKCRGFGYVKYAIQDDADKAVQGSVMFSNRKSMVCYSDKKPRHRSKKLEADADSSETKENENKDVKPTDGKKQEAKPAPAIIKSFKKEDSNDKSENKKMTDKPINEDKQLQKRTVVLIGLSKTANRKKIKKFAMKFGVAESVKFPVETNGMTVALIAFKSYKDAVRAFQKIKGKTLSGCLLDACLLSAIDRYRHKSTDNAAKLILRNLPFSVTEDKLTELGKKYGEVKSVVLPKKVVDGRSLLKGFGFIQFHSTKDAKTALDSLNMTKMGKRDIIVDWAIEKDKFLSSTNELDKGKDENATADEESAQPNQSKNTDMEMEDEDDEGNDSDNNDDEHDDYANDEDGDEDEDDEEKEERPALNLKDAKEGKTVFLSNLLYETEEETIADDLSVFGDVDYCKIVFDHEKNHSKGCGFIKFKTKEAAEKCLAAANDTADTNGGIIVDGRRLNAKLAITKGKLSEIERVKKTDEPKDKRNLYLSNEGVILPNSNEAHDVPAADLVKRKKAWIEKKAKLKNPNFFVSKTRLCVRNLPLTIDDLQLKSAIRKTMDGKDLSITQSKIMRNKDRVDPSGKLRSLGYAFIEFEKHETALATLRKVNNNAEIFGDKRRPIVEFSIENSTALKLRAERQARSKKGAKLEEKPQTENANENRKRTRTQRFKAKIKETKEQKKNKPKGEALSNVAEEKSKKKVTNDDTKKKGSNPKSISTNVKRNEDRDDIDINHSSEAKRRKPNNNPDEISFNKLVNSYKAKLFSPKKLERPASKWFE